MPPGTVQSLPILQSGYFRLCGHPGKSTECIPVTRFHLGGPSGSALLGYAYPNLDTDSDSLADAMEYVIGTNPLLPSGADSDGDGVGDDDEYPQAGVPVSDPCAGPSVTCLRGFWQVFSDGFEQ